jgi:hypothetical protein
MFRKIGLGISYFFAIAYIISFLVPFSLLLECVRLYGLQHCQGNGLDAFLPAAALTPAGTIGAVFSLRNSIQNIRRHSRPWLFWPISIVFAIVLLGVAAMIVIVIVYDIRGNLALHRSIHH